MADIGEELGLGAIHRRERGHPGTFGGQRAGLVEFGPHGGCHQGQERAVVVIERARRTDPGDQHDRGAAPRQRHGQQQSLVRRVLGQLPTHAHTADEPFLPAADRLQRPATVSSGHGLGQQGLGRGRSRRSHPSPTVVPAQVQGGERHVLRVMVKYPRRSHAYVGGVDHARAGVRDVAQDREAPAPDDGPGRLVQHHQHTPDTAGVGDGAEGQRDVALLEEAAPVEQPQPVLGQARPR